MSTQTLHNILNRFREKCGDEILPGESEVLAGAETELEAIEKACVRIAGGYLKVSVLEDGDEPHRDLLERIGEEAAS